MLCAAAAATWWPKLTRKDCKICKQNSKALGLFFRRRGEQHRQQLFWKQADSIVFRAAHTGESAQNGVILLDWFSWSICQRISPFPAGKNPDPSWYLQGVSVKTDWKNILCVPFISRETLWARFPESRWLESKKDYKEGGVIGCLRWFNTVAFPPFKLNLIIYANCKISDCWCVSKARKMKCVERERASHDIEKGREKKCKQTNEGDYKCFSQGYFLSLRKAKVANSHDFCARLKIDPSM